jgi:hypothetical protein
MLSTDRWCRDDHLTEIHCGFHILLFASLQENRWRLNCILLGRPLLLAPLSGGSMKSFSIFYSLIGFGLIVGGPTIYADTSHAKGADTLIRDQEIAKAIQDVQEKREQASKTGKAVDMGLLISPLPVGRICSNGTQTQPATKAMAVVYSPLPNTNPPRFALFEHPSEAPNHYQRVVDQHLTALVLDARAKNTEMKRGHLTWEDSIDQAVVLLLKGKPDKEVLATLRELKRLHGMPSQGFERILVDAKAEVKKGLTTEKAEEKLKKNLAQLETTDKELETLRKDATVAMEKTEEMQSRLGELFQKDIENTYSNDMVADQSHQETQVSTPKVPLFTYIPQQNERDEERSTVFRQFALKEDGTPVNHSSDEVRFTQFVSSIKVQGKDEPVIRMLMTWTHNGQEWNCY